ncbi:RnfABCDGE type electron transport complex subunit D [Maridesulfovibrio hydrothermalis]|uniref:Electron transport complex, RnfABCDGE type, D subunit n=1 Tax=Maridesulfovibrio hydrothermalis AM13 = DSM 14728 TaxID=1121451 RepID=L0RET8_9BACT|nr:RnfABCDGE type electron transport complex subunit D [Maridesulfovibrio hydrothermalis]CCO24727.1 Electron transport complex, RnfABCDGE type, D subunit [Maridesulfovibrio hydrothermalis AM13 = DSM 14728]
MKPISGSPILTVSAPAHIHCGRTIKNTALETIFALLPAAVFAVWHYQMLAVRVLALSCAAAVITETICLYIMKREIEADNYTTLLCGLMLGFLLPPAAPWWLVVLGSSFSIFIGRMIFGGLGAGPLYAPLIGWAILTVSWPDLMDFDMTMLASELTYPLSQLKNFGPEVLDEYPLKSLLLGFQLGGTGAAQTGAILIGGLYMLARKVIRPDIPLAFICGVALTSTLFYSIDSLEYASPLYHLLCGSTLFGAFFLATDSSSSPVGHIPMIAYGFTAGILVIIIRVYGIYPDGVPFAILLANLTTPLFDKIRPAPFGGVTNIHLQR